MVTFYLVTDPSGVHWISYSQGAAFANACPGPGEWKPEEGLDGRKTWKKQEENGGEWNIEAVLPLMYRQSPLP